MAKFAFMVKHNGVIYEAGKEVPVGKEANKTDENNDLSASEIRKELKEMGITSFPSNRKADLLAQLEEAQKAKEEEANKEAEQNKEDEESNEESDLLKEAVKDAEGNKEEEEDSDLINNITNE